MPDTPPPSPSGSPSEDGKSAPLTTFAVAGTLLVAGTLVLITLAGQHDERPAMPATLLLSRVGEPF